jgi:hypothetical protein
MAAQWKHDVYEKWQFEYRIWQWTGHKVRIMDSGKLHPSPSVDSYDELRIPVPPVHLF